MRLAAVFLLALPAVAADIRVVVAQDGTGDYPTVQNAVDHVLDRATAPFSGRAILEIKPGVYKERVRIPPDRPRMTLRGQDAATTTISFSVGAKDVGGTFLSAVLDISGNEFEMENLTVENTYGVGTQAVAVLVHSDRAVFRHCRFLGMQDTLYAASGRQYYDDCYIAGHVDFIFGNAQAVFERCEIHSRGAGYLTAQSRTVAGGPEGFVFDHCRLTADPDVRNVYLGRPWRNYSRVVFLDSWLGPHIRPEQWHNWNKPDAEKTAFYAEFHSTGPGAEAANRVPWARSLTPDEARAFRPDAFLRGSDGWNPAGK